MGIFFYRLSIILYYQAIKLLAPFKPKAKQFVAGRKGTFDLLKKELRDLDAPLIWIHCASLGEFEQGRPIIERIKAEYSSYKVLLTFFSPSGYEVRKNYIHADYVHYLPMDSPSHARRFVALAKPKVAIFVKYEFWHYYIKELHQQQIPVLSVSSIFRPEQIHFKPWGSFQRSTLKMINHFFVQNSKSRDLLKTIGVSQVTVTGDTRFDRVQETCAKAEAVVGIDNFVNNKPTMVIGSSWPEDIDVLLPFIHRNDLKYIIAPHEIAADAIRNITEKLKKPFSLYSEGAEKWIEKDVLIIDNIGLLSRLYKYGQYAYVGGAFGQGLHNILEAATFGIPIFFGNRKYKKFQEAVDLIERKAAFAVGDFDGLQHTFNSLPAENEAGKVARNYVTQNLGATDTIMNYLKPLL